MGGEYGNHVRKIAFCGTCAAQGGKGHHVCGNVSAYHVRAVTACGDCINMHLI